jgi:hypothetical protein
LPERLTVEPDDDGVRAPDDQQRGLAHSVQVPPGQVRAPATGHDRLDGPGSFRRGHQRRGGTGTRAEQPDPQARGPFVRRSPAGQSRHPGGKQADVESQLRGRGVALFFRGGEQVRQHGRQARVLQLRGDVAVARAATAAAATVREHHHATGLPGHRQIGSQNGARRRQQQGLLDDAHVPTSSLAG